MKKHKLFALLSAAVVMCTACPIPSADAFDYAAAKSRVSVHDPSVFKDENTGSYYVFGSHIDAAKSSDLQSWRTFTNGYTTPNNRIFGDLSGNLRKAFAWAGEDLGDCEGGFAVWAPDVIWNPDFINSDGSKGAYLMYFCTSSDYRTSVIAFAASQNPEGPYTFVDTLIYSGFTDTNVTWGNARKTVNRRYSNTNIQELIDSAQVTFNGQWFNNHVFNNRLYPNAIDPNIYYDTDGKMYMCYGSWSGGIFTLEMDPATGKCIHPKSGTTADGRMIDSYFGTQISGGNSKSGEGPFIEYNADTGYYYLFVTYGGLTSTGGYNMRVGRSRNADGPFTDPAGRNMVLDSNSSLDSIGLKLMTNYKFSSLQRAYMACGHNSVLHDDDGQWYLVNHARFDDGTEYHEVRVHAMNFNEAGWPVVMPYEFSGETWSQSGFDPAELAGTYEFINHGNATDGKITTAANITLNADGSISGAVTGSWRESDDTAAATFTIGNVKYTGYFNPQYDESGRGNRVMTFTAAGNNNQTIWGVGTKTWNGSERNVLTHHVGSGQLFYDEDGYKRHGESGYIGDSGLLSDVPYTITNVNSGLVLESAPNALSGAQIQQWAKRGNKSGDANQDFRLVSCGDGYCYIVSMTDERYCVTVNGVSADNGLEVTLEQNQQQVNQMWKLIRSGSYYAIVAKSAGDAAGLDVYEWSKENGGVIKQWEFWGGECQLWKITPTYAMIPEADYSFRNVSSGNMICIGERSNDLYACAEIPRMQHQQDHIFKAERAAYGYYVMSYSGFALTDSNGVLKPERMDDLNTQQFRLFCNADGSYSIVTPDSERAVTESGSSYTLETFTGSAAQKFVMLHESYTLIEHFETTTTVTGTTTTTTETTTAPPAKLRLGDTDCSGAVDVADAVLLARMLAEDSSAVITEQGRRNADCNQNGGMDHEDIVLILKAIALLITLPEV